jgi:hypothetical protein
MIVSHGHRFVYFGPPRTGSTTLSRLFVMRFGGEYDYRPQCDPNPARFLTDVGRAQHQIVLPAEFADYLTVLSVREPFARFRSLSALFGPRHGCRTVEDYFAWAEPPIAREVGEIRIDRVIRLESINADVNALPFVAAPVDLWHERRGPELPPLSGDARKFVAEFYRADFERFGYRR